MRGRRWDRRRLRSSWARGSAESELRFPCCATSMVSLAISGARWARLKGGRELGLIVKRDEFYEEIYLVTRLRIFLLSRMG